MRYAGLVLIPFVVLLVVAGPGCEQAQEEPAVTMEKAVEQPAQTPMMEKAPPAMEEADVPAMEEVEEGVDVEAEKEGGGLLEQLKEKGEEEVEKKADEYEVEKKMDDVGM